MNQQQSLPLPSEGEIVVEVFQKREIRKVHHAGQWWFAIVDVIGSLTDSVDPAGYVRDMRRRDEGLAEGWGQIATPLEVETHGGKQKVNCANIEGLFRLIQSVPSKKAEPFKKWLAKVGFERLQEIDNPELAVRRAITYYRAKGYDDQWIEARLKNKASRESVTLEWKKRGMDKSIGLLTDAISVETFGMGVARHKQLKNLGKSHSLRDNMTPLELTLTTLGEQATTEISKNTNPRTLQQNLEASRQGGRIAGNARQQIEKATGKKVVSSENYLTVRQRRNKALEAQKDTTESLNDIIERFLTN